MKAIPAVPTAPMAPATLWKPDRAKKGGIRANRGEGRSGRRRGNRRNREGDRRSEECEWRRATRTARSGGNRGNSVAWGARRGAVGWFRTTRRVSRRICVCSVGGSARDRSFVRRDCFEAMGREMGAQSAQLCGCLDACDLRAVEQANASLEAAVTAKYDALLALYEALVRRIEQVHVTVRAGLHRRTCSRRPRPPSRPPASSRAPPSWPGCPPATSSSPSCGSWSGRSASSLRRRRARRNRRTPTGRTASTRRAPSRSRCWTDCWRCCRAR